MSDSSAHSAPQAWIIDTPESRSVRIWGLSPSERQRRLLDRAGCQEIRTLDETDDAPTPNGGSVVIVRSDAILDERLVQALVEADDTVLFVALDA